MLAETLPLRQQQPLELLQDHRIGCPADALPQAINFDLESLANLHACEDTHFWSVVRRYLILSLIRRYIAKPDFAFLDAGCGNGSMLKSIEESFPHAQATGIDGYPEALLHCRSRTSTARLVLGDLLEINHVSAPTYDVITVLDVLEHLDHPEIAVRNLSQILKPGSILIATVPAGQCLWSERDVFLGHRKRYSKNDLTALLKGSDLSVLHANYLFSYLVPPTMFVRKMLCRLRRSRGESMERKELTEVPLLNSILKWLGYLEVKLSFLLPLPCGTSAYCIVRKGETA